MIRNQEQKAAVSNERVLRAFIMRIHAHASNLSTDGKVLRSYHWYELATWNGDKVILRAGDMYSQTTKDRHFNPLVKMLDSQKVDYAYSTTFTPHDEGEANFSPQVQTESETEGENNAVL